MITDVGTDLPLILTLSVYTHFFLLEFVKILISFRNGKSFSLYFIQSYRFFPENTDFFAIYTDFMLDQSVRSVSN